MNRRVLHYVDPASGGHHGDYLAFFMRLTARIGIHLKSWVPEKTYTHAVSLVGADLVQAELINGIDTHLDNKGRKALLKRLGDTVLPHEKIFFAMLDPMLPSLAKFELRNDGLRSDWSGLLFRTSFNYPEDEPLLSKARIRSLAKVILMRLLHFKTKPYLLTLDPFWSPSLGVAAHHLPDAMTELDRLVYLKPISRAPNMSSRRSLLFFGSIDARKGLHELLEALNLATSETLSQLRLEVLGKWHPTANYPELSAVIRSLETRGLESKIENGFVSNYHLLDALAECDIVLAPYVDHTGSSGVVGLAAQHGKPVLTQANYQLGRETRTFSLGRAVDTRRPAALLQGLIDLLESPEINHESARRYRDWRNYGKAEEAVESWLNAWYAATPAQR